MRSLDVEVAERSTDEFSLAGGYSTVDGALAEVKMGENNFMDTG
jgi:outer membrane protein insertion porin family